VCGVHLIKVQSCFIGFSLPLTNAYEVQATASLIPIAFLLILILHTFLCRLSQKKNRGFTHGIDG